MLTRSASTWSPGISVGSMLEVGTTYGLTTNAWMTQKMASAASRVNTVSTTAPQGDGSLGSRRIGGIGQVIGGCRVEWSTSWRTVAGYSSPIVRPMGRHRATGDRNSLRASRPGRRPAGPGAGQDPVHADRARLWARRRDVAVRRPRRRRARVEVRPHPGPLLQGNDPR